ncbi:GyrI-like domain-containing protein [Leptospira kmetyi]|uniref:GyrI-like domain-containing protein n=1 Tax=Leptospira kmetyi TaxID=408139 RepID=UPI001083E934|nr:effector binding domain-containing protein [Leptospira kmetyi]TGK17660.1 AraC family transcriptional regulator [Leptospira kmetyi]TGK25080.1 AraC family transcriptional regulator [Leptospira kmetyi]
MKECTMPKKNLIGVGSRTKNADEMGADGKIPKVWGKFFQEVLPKVQNAGDSIYAVYSNYESDENGEYSYFIGIPSDEKGSFETFQLPEGNYLELNTASGKSPDIVIQLWQEVWANQDLKNKRAFAVDYEIYPMDFTATPETQVKLYLSEKR